MKDFFSPLFIFIGGNIALAFAMLLFPGVGSATTQLASDVSDVASNFWGLSWVITSARLFLFIGFEMTILFFTGLAFLKLRR